MHNHYHYPVLYHINVSDLIFKHLCQFTFCNILMTFIVIHLLWSNIEAMKWICKLGSSMIYTPLIDCVKIRFQTVLEYVMYIVYVYDVYSSSTLIPACLYNYRNVTIPIPTSRVAVNLFCPSI